MQKDTLWTVYVIDSARKRIVAECRPGAETIAKALVLAGIDYRLRTWSKQGRAMKLSDGSNVLTGEVEE